MQISIVHAEPSDLPDFFAYLENQLTENGANGAPLFQPLSRKKRAIPTQTQQKFIDGVSAEFSDAAWRQLWLAKDVQGKICGHIDLRHHMEDYCFHRVWLGMGVERECRKMGLGSRLIQTVIEFCQRNEQIVWLDLNVLSVNLAAKNLYLKHGFRIVGEMTDYYRVDDESISELTMSINTEAEPCH
ncbi:GNAT family N-acetyltransferase [Vibrio coralliilyticus]|uniref:GNAT family N-acetyltransferase n=1 Tax=Vibrio coralliilyticus TaxID=190893 RepID=UPI0016B43E5C|nr:GNAT family N-acetyltransferase [Vibrio coralliilyticus]NOI27282.1 GNAT family N-acetyltransferase [Vibrio coralliilyticus]NOI46427.1 GNAT family N-acetyltransferase [Vibrio coralliilyticus]